MRFIIKQKAAPDTIFQPGAFDGSVGKTVPVYSRETEDGPILGEVGMGRLVKAEITENGSVAELEIEVADPEKDLFSRWAASQILKGVPHQPMSFGYNTR